MSDVVLWEVGFECWVAEVVWAQGGRVQQCAEARWECFWAGG